MKRKSIKGLIVLVGLAFLFLTGPSWAAPPKGELRILFTEAHPSMIKRMEAIIDEYKKVNPGANIIMDKIPWGEALQKITAMKAAGDPPELVYVISSQIWTLMQQGWLMPVDDIIEKLGGDKFFLPLPAYVKVNNHYWCVPKGSNGLNLEFRKDLFDKKGLKEPRTWNDLLAAAKALTEDLDGDGKIDRYGIAMPLKREYIVGTFFMSFLWSNGGSVLDKEGRVVFNSPETIQTLKFFKELYQYAPPGVTDYSWLQLVETYSQGKVAMTVYSTMAPFANALKTNETVAKGTDICPIPTRLPNQQSKGRWVNVSWGILNGCRNVELAKDFVTFFFEPKRLTQWYLQIDPLLDFPGEIPVIKSKEYWEDDFNKKYKTLVEKRIELNKMSLEEAMEHTGILQPNTSLINQRLIITDCVQEVVLGKLSAEEAAAKAAKRMEELIGKQKK